MVWGPVQFCALVLVFSVTTVIFLPPRVITLVMALSAGSGSDPLAEDIKRLLTSLTVGSGSDAYDEFNLETEEEEFAYQRQMSWEELRSRRTHVSSDGTSGSALSCVKKFKGLGEVGIKLLHVVVGPLGFVIGWFAFFMVVLAVGMLHWIICLVVSIVMTLEVYLPAVMYYWRLLGSYLVEAVREELEEEELQETKVRTHLYRRESSIRRYHDSAHWNHPFCLCCSSVCCWVLLQAMRRLLVAASTVETAGCARQR